MSEPIHAPELTGATAWLNTTTPVLDYANAMVPNKQPNTAADAQTNWQEHIDGKPQFDPPILPLAPAKFTGGLYIVTGTRAGPECISFSTSLINSTGTYVQTVSPNGAGTTSGMLNLRPARMTAQSKGCRSHARGPMRIAA